MAKDKINPHLKSLPRDGEVLKCAEQVKDKDELTPDVDGYARRVVEFRCCASA
jgi:hypothetical protein